MIESRCQLAGYYKIEAHQRNETGEEIEGSRRIVADWFPNLITNGGLDMLGTTADFLGFCQVGSGSTAPAVTDTALAARVAGVAKTGYAQGTPGAGNVYSSCVATYQFGQGAAAGNLSEIGVGSAATGSLFSRARILDGSGNPTTITVLAIEFLTVTYELRLYINTADVSNSFTTNGTTYNVVSRPCAMGAANCLNMVVSQYHVLPPDSGGGRALNVQESQALAAVGSTPTSNYNQDVAPTRSAYTNGNYYRDFSWTLAVGQGNLATGIGVAFYPAGSAFPTQVQFTPKLAKDNTKTATFTFRVSWGRYP